MPLRRGRARRRAPALVSTPCSAPGFAGDAARRAWPRRSPRSTPRGLPVVSADVPSGVDASSGEVAGEAVRAAATATFHAAKPGLWIDPGKAHAGARARHRHRHPARRPGRGRGRADRAGGARRAFPRRGADSTKFTSGHVLVVGGSTRAHRRAGLAARAAARAGAGYVTACVPASLQAIFAGHLLEAMTRGAARRGRGARRPRPSSAVARAPRRRGGALVLGPGLGRQTRRARSRASSPLRAELPIVLDADGLNAHAGYLDELAARSAPTVLTPHAGELGRLLERRQRARSSARGCAHARGAARRAGAVVVLKGDDTLVAAPRRARRRQPGREPGPRHGGHGRRPRRRRSPRCSPPGSSRSRPPAAAVWLHAGLAGRRRGAWAPEGVIASDVIEAAARRPRRLGRVLDVPVAARRRRRQPGGDRAQLRPSARASSTPGAAVRGRQGRRLRPRRGARARAALAGGATWLAVAAASEAASCARPGSASRSS